MGCTTDDPRLQRAGADWGTWEPLYPDTVVQGERAELERFRKMGVREYVDQAQGWSGPNRKVVKIKSVRTKKGTEANQEVWCHLVAQELAH